MLDKVKQKVDSTSNFPDAMEPIQVFQYEWRQDVIEMALVGDRTLLELKPIAKQIEDELLQLNNVALVELGAPEYEIAVEIEPRVLQKYSLTLNDVSNAIKRYSANYSAGEVRTNAGMISVRIENQYYKGEEFRAFQSRLAQMAVKCCCKISQRSKMDLRKTIDTSVTQAKTRCICRLKQPKTKIW